MSQSETELLAFFSFSFQKKLGSIDLSQWVISSSVNSSIVLKWLKEAFGVIEPSWPFC